MWQTYLGHCEYITMPTYLSAYLWCDKVTPKAQPLRVFRIALCDIKGSWQAYPEVNFLGLLRQRWHMKNSNYKKHSRKCRPVAMSVSWRISILDSFRV